MLGGTRAQGRGKRGLEGKAEKMGHGKVGRAAEERGEGKRRKGVLGTWGTPLYPLEIQKNDSNQNIRRMNLPG